MGLYDKLGKLLDFESEDPKSTEDPKKTASALDDFVQNFHWAAAMSPEQSNVAIENALAEIGLQDAVGWQHMSNGILMTDDGYFLTAAHCITQDHHTEFLGYNKTASYSNFSPFRIRLGNGNSYAIEKVCWSDPSEDIAIVKANMPGSGNPIRYALGTTQELEMLRSALVLHLARWNGRLQTKRARVNPYKVNEHVLVGKNGETTNHDHFFGLDNASGQPGDSGGVIVSPHGRLMGLLCGGDNKGAGYMSAVKLEWALNLVTNYTQYLRW